MNGKRVLLISRGEYSDYNVICLLLYEGEIDIDALYHEFKSIYDPLTPPFPEKRPTERGRHMRLAIEADGSWWNRLRDYVNQQYDFWNDRGYEGRDEKDIFISWLIKDKGFELQTFIEQNLDKLVL